MRYTTTRTRDNVKTQEAWESWVAGLKIGDNCIVQQFSPIGTDYLDRSEYWRFWKAVYLGDKVYFDREAHPIKDGFGVYWNSDDRSGDVFGSRLIPFHCDLAPSHEKDFCDGHLPVFEPNYFLHSRCFIFVAYDNNRTIEKKVVYDHFPHSYEREVEGGTLMTVFADREDVINLTNKTDRATFLYSEYLGT